MCIICNAGDNHQPADDFLYEFSKARKHMEAATRHMLEVSKVCPGPAARKRYDRVHKQMRRICSAWNRIEQEREAPGLEMVYSKVTPTFGQTIGRSF